MATLQGNIMEYQEPTESDKEIVNFVVNHCDRWRDWRDVNCLDDWLEYERIFNGEWDVQDKTRESERSRIVTPATQQAVETRHAEIMEAIFGQGGGHRMAEEHSVDVLGGIPLEMRIREDADSGRPTVVADPDGKATANYKEIARNVAGRLAARKRNYADVFPSIVVQNT